MYLFCVYSPKNGVNPNLFQEWERVDGDVKEYT